MLYLDITSISKGEAHHEADGHLSLKQIICLDIPSTVYLVMTALGYNHLNVYGKSPNTGYHEVAIITPCLELKGGTERLTEQIRNSKRRCRN